MSEIYAPGSIAGPPATFMGPHNSSTSYQMGTAVSCDGSSYVSLVNSNVGNTPASSPTQWALLAAAGTNGTNGANGAPGTPGAPGSASAVSALAAAIMPGFVGRNLYDSTKSLAGMGVSSTDGSVIATGAATLSPMMYCPGATSMITNGAIGDTGWGIGICLYDANGTFISTVNTGSNRVNQWTPFALPGTQTYVRWAHVPSWEGYPPESGMMCNAVLTGTATWLGYLPPGMDTVADVNAKIAASVTTAAASRVSSVQNGIALALATAFPISLSGGSRNAFLHSKSTHDHCLRPDGTLVSSPGSSTAFIYCPNATEFITNLPIRVTSVYLGFCTYDSLGNFIEDLSITLLASASTGLFVTRNVVLPLRGDQSYVRFNYSDGDLLSEGDPFTPMFLAGTVTDPCPASFTAQVPFAGVTPVNIKTASELGCVSDIDIFTGVTIENHERAIDNSATLNAFLATASIANPIKLIIDGGYALAAGLVISPAGFTTIEGIGWGSGIIVMNGASQDAIRIGAYVAATGNSEGFQVPLGPRTATNITLRDFTINANASGNVPDGGAVTAANVPVAGAAPHTIYGVILTNCTNVLVDHVNFLAAPAYAIAVANAGFLKFTGCKFVSVGTLHDGIHIDGPSEDIHISDCYFSTGDDAIALNAPEGYGGDISRVTVTNCIFDGSLTVMRIYTSMQPIPVWILHPLNKIRDVVVSNCVGRTRGLSFNIGITNGGLSALPDADQLQDFSVSNCTLSSPEGLALLLTPIGSISFKGVKFIPTTDFPVIRVWYSICELMLDGVTVLRNPDGNSAPAGLVASFPGCDINKLSLLSCCVVDELGSAYAALPYALDIAGTVSALHLENLDLTHITSLTSTAGWSGVTKLLGSGVIGTGLTVPDSVMDNNALYLSSDSSGAPSIKVGGVAKRLTLV